MVAVATTVTSPASSFTLRTILGRIYARRRDALFATAARVLVSHADADDAVQDAFLAVLESPPRETSERALAFALEGAVRVACGRHVQQRAHDERARIAAARRGA